MKRDMDNRTINVKRGEASLETERWRVVPWDEHQSGEWTWQVEDREIPGRWYDRHRVDRQHRALLDLTATLEADLAAAQRDLDAERQAHAATREGERRRCEAIANGCHDYGGGYRDKALADAFHHGIQTVANALAKAGDPEDTQVAVLESVGRAALAAPAQGEGGG